MDLLYYINLNLLFISFYQNALLLLITLPGVAAVAPNAAALGPLAAF